MDDLGGNLSSGVTEWLILPQGGVQKAYPHLGLEFQGSHPLPGLGC